MLGAFSVAKFATQALTTLGAAKVVSEVIKSNIAVPTTAVNKVLVWTGSTAIGMVVAERSTQHVGDVIDSMVDAAKNYRNKDAAESEAEES